MVACLRAIAEQQKRPLEEIYVWCDYYSISQESRHVQSLAILSLPCCKFPPPPPSSVPSPSQTIRKCAPSRNHTPPPDASVAKCFVVIGKYTILWRLPQNQNLAPMVLSNVLPPGPLPRSPPLSSPSPPSARCGTRGFRPFVQCQNIPQSLLVPRRDFVSLGPKRA
jgi:hypothetical protein